MLHWVMNENMCALTVLENNIRYQITGEYPDKGQSFIGRIIEPIYDFKKDNNNFSICIYAFMICLWLTSVGRIIYKYNTGEINSFRDLFRS